MPKSIPKRQQQAVEEERKRIASHLHDGLGQSLTTLKLRVENALIKLESEKNEEAKDILSDVVIQLRCAIDEVRSLATELRPTMLDDLGLFPTLEWLTRQFQTAYVSIAVHLEIGLAEECISDDLKTVVFRLIQEALNNAGKHAKANAVFIYLRGSPTGFIVGVVDNGWGFEPKQLLLGKYCLLGNGINSMRERVEISEGEFSILSGIGSGTAVIASWGVNEDFSHSGRGLLESFPPHNPYPDLDV